MGAWGVVPSLAYITRVAACPTCHGLDKRRRPHKEFIPSIPGFNGSFWTFTVSWRDASSSDEAGCQFCQVLNKIFRHILTGSGNGSNAGNGTVNVAVPVNAREDDEFHATFRYTALQTETGLVQEISKRFYLTIIQKRIATMLKLVSIC
jgi:hypothetical protein